MTPNMVLPVLDISLEAGTPVDPPRKDRNPLLQAKSSDTESFTLKLSILRISC